MTKIRPSRKPSVRTNDKSNSEFGLWKENRNVYFKEFPSNAKAA